MTKEEIIASGKLEMYVCGSLSAEEISEVEQAIIEHPELRKEIEIIEASLITLAEAVAPPLSAMVWTYIINSIQKVRTLDSASRTNWPAITGWAAAILCIAGIFWMLNENNDLQEDIQITTTENTLLKEQIDVTEGELTEANNILTVLRSKEYTTIMLPGNQAVAPEAFAKVYYNKKENIAYIDASGLPVAPSGKVYQVWSLKLDPLTPTSMGLLSADTQAEKGVYKFDNIPDPEAFGITLEPEGGSATPTLTQLYTLGAVSP
ncbi:anti-sigma-K factor rskA [Ulvibacter sp. MAR_2010_11]|uniref:anti-sigma factor n=1 Tax=Ulvibacter sp. MAR_2010_11 TaxID=1250229 RepID=UPI000C2BA7B4|nr:anti-sigma factor [Ulvibacter sp. MAR_2010_11]PKA83871.1 anti-sigma-K factor rskA [Ulvibacter sp. MAR_2010_11]